MFVRNERVNLKYPHWLGGGGGGGVRVCDVVSPFIIQRNPLTLV